MGRVAAVAEGVEDESAQAAEDGPGLGGDGRDVGAPGEGEEGGAEGGGRVDAVSEDGEAPVQQPEGRDAQAVQVDGFGGADGVGDERGDEGPLDVAFRLEDVPVDAAEVVEDARLGVEVDGCVHDGVEASDLVEAEDVIDVVVCDEDGVEAVEPLAEGLLAQVRPGVEEESARRAAGVGPPEARAGAEAVVARVGGGADGAGASDGGDTRGGSGAEEGEAHAESVALGVA